MTYAEAIKKEFGGLVGRKIVAIRPLKKAELDDMYWDEFDQDGFAIILDDGQVMIPSSDEEGNGPGHILLGDMAR